MTTSAGQLVLVATPIGNLGDMSIRAIETLRAADVIACEDTRHSRKLLNHFDIRDVGVIAVHEHNEYAAAKSIVERIRNGETVALITDAGMPAISDPGERVVAAVADAGLNVSLVPGPSAVLGALAISGLPTERFCFEGFLPRGGKQRRRRLEALTNEERTSVIYEAPHRLVKTVSELFATCGPDRRVVLVRELTKLHEDVWRGTLRGLVEHLGQGEVRGECVLVLSGAVAQTIEVTDDILRSALASEIADGLSTRDAVAVVAEDFGVPKRRVYDLATGNQNPHSR